MAAAIQSRTGDAIGDANALYAALSSTRVYTVGAQCFAELASKMYFATVNAASGSTNSKGRVDREID